MIAKFGFICYNLKNIKLNERNLNRKAFTLFELMVVVMIIGVVYSLVLGSFDPKKSIKIVTLQYIKDALSPYWTKGVKVELVVYDRCRESALLINNEIQEEIETNINADMFKGIKVYKNDRHNGEREITFAPILVENRLHKVCFRFTLFPNGSNSSYVAKSGKRYYTYFPYFEETYVTTKLDDALEVAQKKEFTKITTHE